MRAAATRRGARSRRAWRPAGHTSPCSARSCRPDRRAPKRRMTRRWHPRCDPTGPGSRAGSSGACPARRPARSDATLPSMGSRVVASSTPSPVSATCGWSGGIAIAGIERAKVTARPPTGCPLASVRPTERRTGFMTGAGAGEGQPCRDATARVMTDHGRGLRGGAAPGADDRGGAQRRRDRKPGCGRRHRTPAGAARSRRAPHG